MLDAGGDYAFQLRGEDHAWTPQSVASLQHAVRSGSLADYQVFAATINDQSERLLTIRGLMTFDFAKDPVPLDEVEPASEIVKRFRAAAPVIAMLNAPLERASRPASAAAGSDLMEQ